MKKALMFLIVGALVSTVGGATLLSGGVIDSHADLDDYVDNFVGSPQEFFDEAEVVCESAYSLIGEEFYAVFSVNDRVVGQPGVHDPTNTRVQCAKKVSLPSGGVRVSVFWQLEEIDATLPEFNYGQTNWNVYETVGVEFPLPAAPLETQSNMRARVMPIR